VDIAPVTAQAPASTPTAEQPSPLSPLDLAGALVATLAVELARGLREVATAGAISDRTQARGGDLRFTISRTSGSFRSANMPKCSGVGIGGILRKLSRLKNFTLNGCARHHPNFQIIPNHGEFPDRRSGRPARPRQKRRTNFINSDEIHLGMTWIAQA
jgi:hypothetical protein